ncbi:hypothetical protein U9M48_021028 [Paspalum notatum var. saurae]|uniref:PHD-type domain-containing protein n=1 Tax=Paspalum notatum var. saurae TaxID=547442 RepID=A0AAQ3WT48_PASNO
MEIARNGIASGSARDLPPSKRFKHVGPDLGSAPCALLPAKKRVFPQPPPEEAAVPACLPVKKRAIVAPRAGAEAAAFPFCLPAKKRAIVAAPPVDAAPACLPAKKRAYAPPADALSPACLPAKPSMRAPPPHPPRDVVGSVCALANKRVHAPAPRKDAAAGPVPASRQANRRLCPAPPADALAVACALAKKRIDAPGPREDGARSVPVCLAANKRVMPPPSVESNGARLGTAKGARSQGSNKHSGGAINPRVANGTEGCARGKEFKKHEKLIKPKGIKEQVSMKPRKVRSPSKSKILEKEARETVNGKQYEIGVETAKRSDKAADEKGAALKEEPMDGSDEVAQEGEQEDAAEEDDDGVLCAVCGSTDGDPSDPIVFCDGCDLMVHASCYGNPLAQAIPDGDWFCSLCPAKKSKPAARPSCCLCPARGGAMKRTTEGQLAHISCALLVPEVFFRDPDGRDGIDCSRVPAHRFAKECYICRSSNGCALECSQPKCALGFHVSCGLDGGLCIEYREEKGGAIVAGFCREHSELWEKQQLTGKYKIVARGQE